MEMSQNGWRGVRLDGQESDWMGRSWMDGEESDWMDRGQTGWGGVRWMEMSQIHTQSSSG